MDPNQLNGEERKVYELITRHFLACCSPDAIGQESTATIDIAREMFTTRGLMIRSRGYLDVYRWEKWNAKVRQSTFHFFFSLLYCCTYICTYLDTNP